jgi:hypothetical protein
VGAVFNRLLGMESAFTAGEALHQKSRVIVD